MAVDPGSKTSPSNILNEWKTRLSDLTIIEWTDSDYTKRNLQVNASFTPRQKTDLHRARQKIFYQACTRYLQTQKRTWTAYIDVDEVRHNVSYVTHYCILQ